MIKISIGKNSEGRVRSFKISGHACFAPHGRDIVCAAVSAVVQTAIYGMIRVIKIRPKIVMEEGLLECCLPEDMTREEGQKADLLVETMLTGLKEIKKEYPNHIMIITVLGGENNEN